jgi:hypothetical protein
MISSHDQFTFNSSQPASGKADEAPSALTRETRLSWIGSKLAQLIDVEGNRLDDLHHRMWMRILQSGLEPAAPRNETDQLAIHILAVATLADDVAAKDGPKAAMAAVMQASGKTLEPLLAEKFLRLASSPIFWMALRSDGIAAA